MRVFANGRFHTSDGRARFVPSAGAGAAARNTAWPLTLNTGRVRDHWHTMTRTGRSPRLSQHMAEPFAEIHPADARRAGISDAEIVRVSTPRGAILVRALLSRRAAEGSIFVPMHWNDQFTASARVGRLVEAVTDPVSGQPALKSSPARVERFAAAAYGFAVTRRRPNAIHAEYWSLAACPGGWRIELAFAACPADWERFAGNLFGLAEAGELLAYEDGNARQHRFASFRDGILEGALFVAPKPVAVSRGWAVAQLGEPGHARNDRFRLAAGQLGADRPDAGAIVCSCFNVGVKQIAAAAAAGCVTLAAVGQALRAGTNCGSCRAEIKAIVDTRALAAE